MLNSLFADFSSGFVFRINALFVSTADLRTKHVNWHLEQLATDGLNNLHSELTVFADIFLGQMTSTQLAYLVRILN